MILIDTPINYCSILYISAKITCADTFTFISNTLTLPVFGAPIFILKMRIQDQRLARDKDDDISNRILINTDKLFLHAMRDRRSDLIHNFNFYFQYFCLCPFLDRHTGSKNEGTARNGNDDFRHDYPVVYINEISILNYRTAPSLR